MKHVQECNDSLRTPCLTSKHFSKVNSSLSHVWATFRPLSSMLVATSHCFFPLCPWSIREFYTSLSQRDSGFYIMFCLNAGFPVSWEILEKPGIFLEPGKPWYLTKISKNPWKTLEFILSFLSLRLESCFIYYPVI